ncbi:MAG: Arc family DNA-binding protein [Acinetobacter sp.]
MSEDQSSVVTLKVRVTPEFREKITETAKSNNRSMNQEIVDRLEKSFEPDFFRITKFNDLKEPAASIEIGAITIGLYESQYKEIKLTQLGLNYWLLSYHAVLCHLKDESAKQLIELGCTCIAL